jgi:hypothetical protein
MSLYDFKIQNRIRKVQYSLESKTPLYKTVDRTPAKVVDEFMIYKHESQHCINNLAQQRQKEKDGDKKRIRTEF